MMKSKFITLCEAINYTKSLIKDHLEALTSIVLGVVLEEDHGLSAKVHAGIGGNDIIDIYFRDKKVIEMSIVFRNNEDVNDEFPYTYEDINIIYNTNEPAALTYFTQILEAINKVAILKSKS